jgi:hypothetical protein
MHVHRHGRGPRPAGAVSAIPCRGGSVWLRLQRQAGNGAVSRLLGAATTQREPDGGAQDGGAQDIAARHRAVLAGVQGLPINGLIRALEKLTPDVLADTAAGRAAGGPRLVLAMGSITGRDKPWTDFVTANDAELTALGFDDQIVAIVASVGGPADYTADKQLPQWPEKFAKGDGPDGLPATMRARLIQQALRNRAALPVWSDLAAQQHGYKYIGDPQAFASGGTSRLERIARKEILGEGGPTAVNTYDNNHPPLTLGAGFLQQTAITWMSAWLAKDVTAASSFRRAGVEISAGTIQAMGEDGAVVDGRAAMQVFADSPQLLSMFMALGEAPGSRKAVIDAQLDWIRTNHINAAATEADKAGWSDLAIAVCMHINHWLPAFGWGSHKADYLATGGSLLQIVKAFGRLAGDALPNGAVLVGNGPTVTTPFTGSHFDAFGGGGGSPGAAKTAATAAGTPVHTSIDQIGSRPENAGFLFFRLGDTLKRPAEGDWLRLPAH